MDVLLAQNETVVTQITIPATLFTKSQYQLTTKRLIAETQQTFLGLIPISKTAHTYPLKNVAGVEFRTRPVLWLVVIAALFVVFSLWMARQMGSWLVPYAIAYAALCVFWGCRGYFVVANNAGQKIEHVVWVTGRRPAREFVNLVNRSIVEQ